MAPRFPPAARARAACPDQAPAEDDAEDYEPSAEGGGDDDSCEICIHTALGTHSHTAPASTTLAELVQDTRSSRCAAGHAPTVATTVGLSTKPFRDKGAHLTHWLLFQS